jgi:hypothetical protein
MGNWEKREVGELASIGQTISVANKEIGKCMEN